MSHWKQGWLAKRQLVTLPLPVAGTCLEVCPAAFCGLPARAASRLLAIPRRARALSDCGIPAQAVSASRSRRSSHVSRRPSLPRPRHLVAQRVQAGLLRRERPRHRGGFPMSLQNLVRRIRHPSPHLAPSLPAAGTAPGLRPPSRPLQGLSAVRAHQGGPYHNPSKTTTHLSHCYPAARGLAVIKQKLSRMCQGGSPPWHPPGPARPSPCHPLPKGV